MGQADRASPKALSWHCSRGAHSKHTAVCCVVGVSSCIFCMRRLACSVARLACVQALGAQGLAGSFLEDHTTL
jgi:hypothetical protein